VISAHAAGIFRGSWICNRQAVNGRGNLQQSPRTSFFPASWLVHIPDSSPSLSGVTETNPARRPRELSHHVGSQPSAHSVFLTGHTKPGNTFCRAAPSKCLADSVRCLVGFGDSMAGCDPHVFITGPDCHRFQSVASVGKFSQPRFSRLFGIVGLACPPGIVTNTRRSARMPAAASWSPAGRSGLEKTAYDLVSFPPFPSAANGPEASLAIVPPNWAGSIFTAAV